MSIAAILVSLDGGPGSEAALRTALAGGRLFDCYVEVLHVAMDPESSVPVLGENMSGAAVQQLIDSLRAGAEQRLQEARRLFETLCADGGLKVVEPDDPPSGGGCAVSWRQVTGREDDEIAWRSRLFDLTVVGRPDHDRAEAYPAALEAALFRSGRPLLVAPPAACETLGSSVAVAWDGSREAARGVAAALPFLEKARRIALFTVQEKDEVMNAEELVRYLARHGLSAERRALEPDFRSVGGQLMEEAVAAGADLFVMGGYGHSRLREFVLGGVTRTVLRDATIPVLMAH